MYNNCCLFQCLCFLFLTACLPAYECLLGSIVVVINEVIVGIVIVVPVTIIIIVLAVVVAVFGCSSIVNIAIITVTGYGIDPQRPSLDHGLMMVTNRCSTSNNTAITGGLDGCFDRSETTKIIILFKIKS